MRYEEDTCMSTEASQETISESLKKIIIKLHTTGDDITKRMTDE